MNKLVISIIGFFFVSNLYSQESELYKRLDFESFVKNKTSDSYNYVRTIYKKLYYQPTKENESDTSFSILMICNGNKKIELIGMDSDDEFYKEIKKVLTLVNEEFLIDDNEKYITEIPVIVDFEPQEEFNWRTDFSEIHTYSFGITKKM